MTIDERARKICREIAYKIHGEQARFEDVLAELRAVQKEAFEKAAEIAETIWDHVPDDLPDEFDPSASLTQKEIVERIRKLAGDL